MSSGLYLTIYILLLEIFVQYFLVLCMRFIAPPNWSKEPQDIETVEGAFANVYCAADGSPVPRIVWKFVGKTVTLLKKLFNYSKKILNKKSYPLCTHL